MAAAESTALALVDDRFTMAPSAETIKRAAGAANMPDDQFEVFLAIARRTGLDPLARQIYAIPRQTHKKDDKGKWRTETAWTIQTGIDGYRVMAARTGQLAGIDDPIFDAEHGPHPNKATCTVYRFTQGQRVPFTASARWSEYVQTKAVYEDGERTDKTQPTEMWLRMPYLMLGKCAEALALRRAFPAELSGVYTGEEMAQADNYVEAQATIHEEPTPAALTAPHDADAYARDMVAAGHAIADKIPLGASGAEPAVDWPAIHQRMRAVGIEPSKPNKERATFARWAAQKTWEAITDADAPKLVESLARIEAKHAAAEAKVKTAASEPEPDHIEFVDEGENGDPDLLTKLPTGAGVH